MRLVIEEEEALVPPDGASQCSSELVAVQPAHLGQEKIARVKHIVAPELEERTVKAVGAGLRDQTDLAEGGLSQLRCVGVGLYLELLDSVDGGAHGDVAELPGIVAGAVQREIILVVSSADGNARAEAARSRSNREIDAARARGCSWHKQEQLREVPAVERDLRGVTVVHNLANYRVLRLQLGRLSTHC